MRIVVNHCRIGTYKGLTHQWPQAVIALADLRLGHGMSARRDPTRNAFDSHTLRDQQRMHNYHEACIPSRFKKIKFGWV